MASITLRWQWDDAWSWIVSCYGALAAGKRSNHCQVVLEQQAITVAKSTSIHTNCRLTRAFVATLLLTNCDHSRYHSVSTLIALAITGRSSSTTTRRPFSINFVVCPQFDELTCRHLLRASSLLAAIKWQWLKFSFGIFCFSIFTSSKINAIGFGSDCNRHQLMDHDGIVLQWQWPLLVSGVCGYAHHNIN